MNKSFFKQLITSLVEEKDNHHSKMIAAHRRLKNLMNIDNEDIQDMMENQIVLETSSYYITVRTICFKFVWRDLLIIVPKTMGTHNIGYKNVPVNTPDESEWYYKPDGTCTIFYPEQSIWENIEEEIRGEL